VERVISSGDELGMMILGLYERKGKRASRTLRLRRRVGMINKEKSKKEKPARKSRSFF
jgi:hypothetical protein